MLSVEVGVYPLTCTATVEAVQADIETSDIVDAVETERAVFTVYGVGWLR